MRSTDTFLNELKKRLKPRKTWKDKLNKKELKHIRNYCGGTLRGLKLQLEHNKTQSDRFSKCYECEKIAEKLKIK